MENNPVSTLPPDPTIDEIRACLAEIIPAHAGFDGWTDLALNRAAEQAGIDTDIARLAFPGGATDMIDAWFEALDRSMTAAFPDTRLASMKMREKISALIMARFEAAAPHREALRRALALLAMPQNILKASRLTWRAVDTIWRLAGDTSADYNHYTKRMTLTAVYGSTAMIFLNDENPDLAETRAFLARRVEGVMQFEKTKAQLLGRGSHRPSLSRFIGRLRYPAI